MHHALGLGPVSRGCASSCLATPGARPATFRIPINTTPHRHGWIGVGSAWHSTHAALVEPHAFHALSLCLPKLPVPGPGPGAWGVLQSRHHAGQSPAFAPLLALAATGRRGCCQALSSQGDNFYSACLDRRRCAALRRAPGRCRRSGCAVRGAQVELWAGHVLRMVGLEVDYWGGKNAV